MPGIAKSIVPGCLPTVAIVHDLADVLRIANSNDLSRVDHCIDSRPVHLCQCVHVKTIPIGDPPPTVTVTNSVVVGNLVNLLALLDSGRLALWLLWITVLVAVIGDPGQINVTIKSTSDVGAGELEDTDVVEARKVAEVRLTANVVVRVLTQPQLLVIRQVTKVDMVQQIVLVPVDHWCVAGLANAITSVLDSLGVLITRLNVQATMEPFGV